MYDHEIIDEKYRSKLSAVKELYNPHEPEDKARQADLRPHYFEWGVIAHTDLIDIGILPVEFAPYTLRGREPVIAHEKLHIRRHHQNRPQNERSINREVIYRLGLSFFPFPSY